jgi:hypothetical protein
MQISNMHVLFGSEVKYGRYLPPISCRPGRFCRGFYLILFESKILCYFQFRPNSDAICHAKWAESKNSDYRVILNKIFDFTRKWNWIEKLRFFFFKFQKKKKESAPIFWCRSGYRKQTIFFFRPSHLYRVSHNDIATHIEWPTMT